VARPQPQEGPADGPYRKRAGRNRGMGSAEHPERPPTRGRLRRQIGTFGAIALGGALGTPARVELGRVLPTGPGFPWGTFVANVVGSLLLGAGAGIFLGRLGPSRPTWLVFATGFCGSFTTLSTFAVDVDLKLRAGDVVVGLAYAVVSVLVGLVAVVAGLAVGRRRLRPRPVFHGDDT
jgi:fluoride exporter